ncbi:MAG: DUF2384 domain-containing protein [Chitinophagaceae bacterium]|nr:DUF2384 domain-containing protein [Chitinophagaceae bacterium]
MSCLEPKKGETGFDREITVLLKDYDNKPRAKGRLQKFSIADILADKTLIIKAIQKGIPYSFFKTLRETAPFSETEWASFLNLSAKSLQRYKQSPRYHFRPIHSEKIIQIAEVTKAGLDVFGDIGKFRLWLDTPNFALGNRKPVELLKDSYGKELMLGELTRINHGILA